MNSDDSTPAMPLDKLASRARATLVTGIVLLAICIIYSAVANLGWLSWVLARGWAISLFVVVFGLIALFLFDITRSKNIAWRALRQQFSDDFGEILDRKNFATGRGQVGDFNYLGLRCFGSPSGLEINRIVSHVNPPLYIPWSAMDKVDSFPNLLTGRKDFETDMQAQILLRNQSDVTIEVPWLTEYRQLLPKSVKFRAIKLSKK